MNCGFLIKQYRVKKSKKTQTTLSQKYTATKLRNTYDMHCTVCTLWNISLLTTTFRIFLALLKGEILHTWCCSLCWPLQQRSRGWRTSRALPSVFSRCPNLEITHYQTQKNFVFYSVPDPPDLHVFGPPGSGSFYHHSSSKNRKKILDSYCFATSFGLFIIEKWCKSTLKK